MCWPPLIAILAPVTRRLVRPQIDDKICNFFGLAEASERDLRQDLSWDSPDDSRTGVNIIAFPSSLEDRREVRTATGTLGQPERWSSGRSGHFPWHWHGSIRRDCLDHVVVLGDRHLRHLLKSYQKYYNEAHFRKGQLRLFEGDGLGSTADVSNTPSAIFTGTVSPTLLP
jgi:hypothetical protein